VVAAKAHLAVKFIHKIVFNGGFLQQGEGEENHPAIQSKSTKNLLSTIYSHYYKGLRYTFFIFTIFCWCLIGYRNGINAWLLPSYTM
jgi:hypothetical protein